MIYVLKSVNETNLLPKKITAAVFISLWIVRRNGGSVTTKGFKTQGATIRKIKGLYHTMIQLNLETGVRG